MRDLTGPEMHELDIQIATKVMGLCVHDWIVEDTPDTFPPEWKAHCKNCPELRGGGELQRWPVSGQAHSYSGTIDDAWRVLNELRRRGFAVAVVSTKDNGWACDVALGDFAYLNPQRQEGTTAPLAICRAALAALGEA